MSVSCIYEGTVTHRRRSPRRAFRYSVALAYVDLAELPRLLGGRLASRRPGLLRFRRADYLGAAAEPLEQAVRARVLQATGRRPAGPIRVLAQLRSWGHCFNPVSFYYCVEPGGERLEAIVAEVTNTPWGERHAYVLDAGEEPTALLRDSQPKRMHVSPLMGMDQRYEFRAAVPGPTLSLQIESTEHERAVFEATLALRRRELTPGAARRLAWRYPFASLRVLALIYAQALRARLAGAGYHPRPQVRGA